VKPAGPTRAASHWLACGAVDLDDNNTILWSRCSKVRRKSAIFPLVLSSSPQAVVGIIQRQSRRLRGPDTQQFLFTPTTVRTCSRGHPCRIVVVVVVAIVTFTSVWSAAFAATVRTVLVL